MILAEEAMMLTDKWCGSGSGAFLIPGSGIRIRNGKKSGSGMRIPDNFFESLETVFRSKILKFFDDDPDPGSGIFWSWIRDGKIRIPIAIPK
jgi:hypothetical protein